MIKQFEPDNLKLVRADINAARLVQLQEAIDESPGGKYEGPRRFKGYMKTTLPTHITSIEEAKKFLSELHSNGEHIHPEDDAFDIIWKEQPEPTDWEKKQLNYLMKQIYALEGNDDPQNMAFDPCGYLLDLDKTEEV